MQLKDYIGCVPFTALRLMKYMWKNFTLVLVGVLSCVPEFVIQSGKVGFILFVF